MERKSLHIGVGDIVKVYGSIRALDKQDEFDFVIAKVMSILPRYGRYNKGETVPNPLVTVRYETSYLPSDPFLSLFQRHEVGSVHAYDSSFIFEVLQRSKAVKRLPFNYIRYRYEHWRPELHLHSPKYYGGDLLSLISHVIEKLPYHIPHHISERKAFDLADKSMPGVVHWYHGYLLVRRKPFERWVKQNVYKLLMTSKEVIAQETEANTVMEETYWRSVSLESSY